MVHTMQALAGIWRRPWNELAYVKVVGVTSRSSAIRRSARQRGGTGLEKLTR